MQMKLDSYPVLLGRSEKVVRIKGALLLRVCVANMDIIKSWVGVSIRTSLYLSMWEAQ